MRDKEVLSLLKVHRVTLNKYVREGKIRVTEMANGRYEYNDDDVYSFIGKRVEKHGTKVISYSRVSTQNQKRSTRRN